jgi:outer membrane protein OmpA-like peptidoglycan-associated protein
MKQTHGLALLWLCASLLSCAPGVPDPAPDVNRTLKSAAVGAAGGAGIGAIAGGGPATPIGLALGATLGAVVGYNLDHTMPQTHAAADRLINNGISVIHQGEQVRVILPEKSLFLPSGVLVQNNGMSNLDQVANYLKLFRTVQIEVISYLDAPNNTEEARSFTQQRANGVANYLWAQGLDTRMIAAEGRGDAEPIASNQLTDTKRMNRRVEVRFRYLAEEELTHATPKNS